MCCQCSFRGDSPFAKVKQTIARAEDVVSLVASYEGDREDVGYTITVYSDYKASPSPPQTLLYTKDVCCFPLHQRRKKPTH